MGQARKRKLIDPLYGVLPRECITSPLWIVHKGVLFLVGQGDSLACLPAANNLTPNGEQLAVLEEIISSNPSLLNGRSEAAEVPENIEISDQVDTVSGILAPDAMYTIPPVHQGCPASLMQ
jgi:hypothetical protein